MIHLVDFTTKYNRTGSKIVAKMGICMKALIKHLTFGPFDPTQIMGFLKRLKLTCSTNVVQEDAALFLYFVTMFGLYR